MDKKRLKSKFTPKAKTGFRVNLGNLQDTPSVGDKRKMIAVSLRESEHRTLKAIARQKRVNVSDLLVKTAINTNLKQK